jgi:hypothetical protein
LALVFVVQELGEFDIHEFHAEGEARARRDLDAALRQADFARRDAKPLAGALPPEVLDELIRKSPLA